MTIRGLATNEFKSSLIKRGYDIYCPECGHHFSRAELSHNVKCPNCGHRWKVDERGMPQ